MRLVYRPAEQPLQAQRASQVAVCADDAEQRVQIEEQEADADQQVAEHEKRRGVHAPLVHRMHRQRVEKGPSAGVPADKDRRENGHRAQREQHVVRGEHCQVQAHVLAKEEPHHRNRCEPGNADHSRTVRGHDLVDDIRRDV
jgi:hypothetical protein